MKCVYHYFVDSDHTFRWLGVDIPVCRYCAAWRDDKTVYFTKPLRMAQDVAVDAIRGLVSLEDNHEHLRSN